MDALTGPLEYTSLEERQASATSKALRLLDVLNVLFDFCSNATLASSAQVCKSWSTQALRRLWRRLKDPAPLLRLLDLEVSTSVSPHTIAHAK